MSVAEMKLAAIQQISQLNDEKAIQEILDRLDSLSKKDSATQKEQVVSVFNEAGEQYGNTLKKLAE